MLKRPYSNVSSGAQSARLTFEEARRLIHDAYVRMADEFFQETFGYSCTDGFQSGAAGENIRSFVYGETLVDGVTDLASGLAQSKDETVLFTLIEFFHDHVSKGIDGHYHSYNDCGWHYSTFDKPAGQREWRKQVGGILAHYGEGFVFTETSAPSGLRDIAHAKVPSTSTADDNEKVEAAVQRFRRARATRKEHVDAIRDLADVLERLRPKVKEHLLTEDERLLFKLANNFGIRHHNDVQKKGYDSAWLAWMFYVYLSTIHLVLRLIERDAKTNA